MQHTERNSKVEVEDREKAMAEAQMELRTGITLTQRAADKLKRIFAEQNMPEGSCLRVGIKGGGCSGFSYTLDVAAKPADDDEVFEAHGLRVVCDPKSYLYLSGTEVDYNDSLLNGGFVFNNPNSKRTCGCGASFAV
ncbi:MAG: HesB/IscA family protein [Phycisphaerae bacterium]